MKGYFVDFCDKRRKIILNIGIIGAGGIAGLLAGPIQNSTDVELIAIASRRESSAKEFAAKFNIPTVFSSWQEMLSSDQIDAVYVATPTHVKEEICIAAAKAGKHILAEKPFASEVSLDKIIEAVRENKVAFLDGTHFVHNPRTFKIKQSMAHEIGDIKALRTTFFYPFDDRNNIRFDTAKEPLTSVGDLAWYNMRAIVEFLDTDAPISKVSASSVIDEETGAIIRGAGVMEFEDGKSSTFDFGFDVGVCLMDLDILGSDGLIRLDDFVLDWHSGFDFSDGHYDLGFSKREHLQEPDDWHFDVTKSIKSQKILMVEKFAALSADPRGAGVEHSIKASHRTQNLLDALWKACVS